MKSNFTTVLLIILIIALMAGGIFAVTHMDQITEWMNKVEEKVTNSKVEEDAPNTVTQDFKVSGVYRDGNELTFSSYLVSGDYFNNIYYTASKFNLPSNLYDYRDVIRVRLTYSPEDLTVYDCKVLNAATNEIIENPTEENLVLLMSR